MRRITDYLDSFVLVLLLVSSVAYTVFFYFSNLAETLFGRGIYVVLRSLFDHTIGLLPFAGIYLVFGCLLLTVFWVVRHYEGTWPKLKGLLQILIFLVMSFFWLWGYNYARPDIKSKLELSIPDVDSTVLLRQFQYLTDSMVVWRAQMEKWDYLLLEKEVQSSVRSFLVEEGLPAPGHPRVRRLKPGGILLGTSTAGIFLPFSMEAHIDAGLHWLTWPHVMSHEMAHGYGITDEGECNFIASISCRKNKDAYFKYSAALYDIKLLYGALIRIGIEERRLKPRIPAICLSDMTEIREKHDAYPNYIPELWRNWIYDKYLKSQGISSGLRSYGEVLGLLLAWQEREGGG